GPVEPGPHSLLARTIAGERVSEPIVVAFRAEAPAGSQSAAVESLPPMWAVAAMMLVVVTLLSPLLWKLRTVKK
ncbi:MAG TPA: hypothetical protein VI818_03315, partial [Candidatus Thermoplasmatota archaeon]|nr:hypothetical protein [Candidatus Thermoplasmatota archaeon]